MSDTQTNPTNPNAIRTAYDELQAVIDGDLEKIEDTPYHIRRRVCVRRSRKGKVILAD